MVCYLFTVSMLNEVGQVVEQQLQVALQYSPVRPHPLDLVLRNTHLLHRPLFHAQVHVVACHQPHQNGVALLGRVRVEQLQQLIQTPHGRVHKRQFKVFVRVRRRPRGVVSIAAQMPR